MKPARTDTGLRVHRFPVTPAVIWAMAVQTFRQCVRRKVLLVLLFFVATVLVGSRVMPTHDMVKRVEMLIKLCLYSISFFGIIVAIFLSATALPEDRKKGTLTTVLTKPVGRLNYLIGRIFGFGLTLGVILLVMGAVSWGFIRWAAAQVPDDARPDDLLVGKRGINPSHVDLPGELLSKEDKDRLLWQGILSGSAQQRIVFSFRENLDQLGGDELTLELTPRVESSSKLPNTPAEIVVENPKGTVAPLRFDRTLDSRRMVSVSFPRTMVDPIEGVNISIRRLLTATRVQFPRDGGSIHILTTPVSFEYGYFKSLVMIFFGFMLAVVVSMTASTFLSAWVAVLLAFTAYFFAEFQGVLRDFMAGLQGQAIGLFGSAAFGHQHHHGPAVAAEPDPSYVVVLNEIWFGCLWVLTHIFPNFGVFDGSRFLMRSYDVPGMVVASSALIFFAYGTCYLILGHVIFWRRELTP